MTKEVTNTGRLYIEIYFFKVLNVSIFPPLLLVTVSRNNEVQDLVAWTQSIDKLLSFWELDSMFPVLKVYSVQQTSQVHSYWTRGNQQAGPTWSRRSCSCCHFSCRLRSSSGSHAQNLNCSGKTKKATPWSELDALPGQEDNELPIWYPRDTETYFHTAKCPLWRQKPFPNVIPFYFDPKPSGCFYAFVLLYG